MKSQTSSSSFQCPARCCTGEPGDRVQFSELIIANVRLYALRNERKLSTKAVANFTRQQLATALRKVSVKGLLGSRRCIPRQQVRGRFVAKHTQWIYDTFLSLAQGPYQANLLLAGFDETTGPALYLIDYLGTMHSMNMAGTGYGKLRLLTAALRPGMI